MGIETEVKFKVEHKDEIISALKEQGFEKEDSYRERNILIDRNEEMEKSDRLLRFRKIENSKSAEIFTYKGPRKVNMKTRKEIEFEADIKRLIKVFKELGYSTEFKYEKVREVWTRGDAEVVIDELPFLDTFMEIEGTEEEIEKIAEDLELPMNESITKTYTELFESYKEKNDIDQKDLIWEKFTIEDL